MEDNQTERRLLRGRWVRFSGYSIRHGCVVVSDESFDVYDPWQELDEGRRSARGAEAGRKASLYAPYLELGRLAARLPEPSRYDTVPLSQEQQRAIIDWYVAHGALGLLSQRTVAATVYPEWDRPPVEVEVRHTRTELGPGSPVVVQRAFTRTARGWVSRQTRLDERAPTADDREHTVEMEEPWALMTSVDRWEPEPVPIDQAWGPYFPELQPAERKEYRYPKPNSFKFWLESGEPVKEFIAAAYIVKQIVEDLGQREDHDRRVRGRRLLNALLVPTGIHPERHSKAGKMMMVCEAPSLLATLSMMIMSDLVGDESLKACRWCHRPFVSRKADYCSPRCASAFRQKTLRDKHRQEEMNQRS